MAVSPVSSSTLRRYVLLTICLYEFNRVCSQTHYGSGCVPKELLSHGIMTMALPVDGCNRNHGVHARVARLGKAQGQSDQEATRKRQLSTAEKGGQWPWIGWTWMGGLGDLTLKRPMICLQDAEGPLQSARRVHQVHICTLLLAIIELGVGTMDIWLGCGPLTHQPPLH